MISIDVYRRKIPACRSRLDFALFVAFFPQLVAGPIVRASGFLTQLSKPTKLHYDQTTAFLIVRGLAKKVLIADNLAPFADRVFSEDPFSRAWPSAIVWLATLCFSAQIYCDFSGYSDIAIGVGRILGFQLPVNFNRPYFARNPSDFWRRWHISLSSWLRDYLYVPLGGSRKRPLITYRNLLLTMLLGGLWHGASWNFVLWGSLHAIFLMVHRKYGELRRTADPSYQPSNNPLVVTAAVLLMQYCVLVTWITFRVSDTEKMLQALAKFVIFDFTFSFNGLGLGGMSVFSTVLILSLFFLLHSFSFWKGGLDERFGRLQPRRAAFVGVGVGVLFFVLWPLSEAPFIYFHTAVRLKVE